MSKLPAIKQPINQTKELLDLMNCSSKTTREMSIKGHSITLGIGQLVFSQRGLAKRWKCTHKKVRVYLLNAIKKGTVSIVPYSTLFSVMTINAGHSIKGTAFEAESKNNLLKVRRKNKGHSIKGHSSPHVRARISCSCSALALNKLYEEQQQDSRRFFYEFSKEKIEIATRYVRERQARGKTFRVGFHSYLFGVMKTTEINNQWDSLRKDCEEMATLRFSRMVQREIPTAFALPSGSTRTKPPKFFQMRASFRENQTQLCEV